MTRESLEWIQQMVKPASVLIGYGPTEAVVTPMVWPVTAEMRCETAYAPIGRPVGERTSYILDADLNLAPVGVVGELYMGARGWRAGIEVDPG